MPHACAVMSCLPYLSGWQSHDIQVDACRAATHESAADPWSAIGADDYEVASQPKKHTRDSNVSSEQLASQPAAPHAGAYAAKSTTNGST